MSAYEDNLARLNPGSGASDVFRGDWCVYIPLPGTLHFRADRVSKGGGSFRNYFPRSVSEY
jgi:hypothetical protein